MRILGVWCALLLLVGMLPAQSAPEPLDFERVLSLIENHPESPELAKEGLIDPQGAPDHYEQAKSAWEFQLSQHRDSANVLCNAAIFLRPSDPARSIELLEDARALVKGDHDFALAEAATYLSAFKRTEADPNAEALKSRLLASADAELLGAAGTLLSSAGTDASIKQTGLRLLERAITLDPTNVQLRASLTAAQRTMAGPREPYRMKVDPVVAEANLIDKSEPAYPILAQSGRIQGDVKLTAVIDQDGDVEKVTLISGPPLLVSAAKDAALQWKYKPFLLTDKPVSVITEVTVSFSLNR